MKNIKKIGALVLAVVMVMAMSATALAADADLSSDGIVGDFTNDAVTAQEKSVKLYKEITAYNPENSTINAPTITYTYTVTPGTANKEIYDVKTAHTLNTNVHAYTKAGITTGVTVNSGTAGDSTSASGTVAWTPADQLTASSAGTKNTKPIVINFSGVTYTGAGVYRYTITEAATSYNSSGVVDGGITNVRYLDVYVKDGSSAGTYDIYGYVCFINDNNIDAQDTPTASTPNTVTAAAKTEGFVATTTGGTDGATTQTADEYYTYNLTITKVLSGDQAMNSHKFPFSLDFANSTVNGNVLPIVSGTGTVPTLTAGDINGMDQDGTNLKLANGETAVFTGIPVGTTVTINEKNDVTGTVYTTSTGGGTTNQSSGLAVSWNTWTNAVTGWTPVTALQKTANDNTVKADENMTVTFTNTLLNISPTGVAFRVAPYVLMLAAGMFLLLVSRHRRKDEEEYAMA